MAATNDDTIVAIATPPGSGAIAIVRMSGPRALALGSALFPSQAELRDRHAAYGDVVDEDGRRIDRGLALYCRGPHSYTGEDTIEFQVHGSPVVAREVVRAALALGARAAGPGEFTRRAFMNGRMDLHAAAAVADLIAAESRSAARAALANLGGGLASEVRALRAQVASVLEELAGAVDFPDEVPEPDAARVRVALDDVTAVLERLRRDGETGRVVREGVNVAIVGPPNAGKSSLLNALLGEERALVSEIPGTTRDSIEETIAIDGVAVRLVDTAGIRSHSDRLEAAGIARTHRALASARIALIVLDGARPIDGEARALIERTHGRDRIVFFNKADLGDEAARAFDCDGKIVGSVRYADTLCDIRAAIAQLGWGGVSPDVERPHLSAAREFDAVNAALDALARARATIDGGDPIDFVAGELQRAHASLGHITGDEATEELISGIFARFCIGK